MPRASWACATVRPGSRPSRRRLQLGLVVLVGLIATADRVGEAQHLPSNRGLDPHTPPVESPQQRDAIEFAGDSRSVAQVVDEALSPHGVTSTLKVMLALSVLSLAPSMLVMTTCFVRFVIVLGLLRQALGTQHAPPNQVVLALSMFLTLLVMAPVWRTSYESGIRPYTQAEPDQPPMSFETALERTLQPARRFMSDQIESAGNTDGLWMLLDFQRGGLTSTTADPVSYDDVPLSVLVPAYLLSELKTAFLIGFQIYLPFVVIDMVVSALLVGMGMLMMPPFMISLPFKLLLFVLIDGWYLTAGMLLESVQTQYG